MIILDQNAYRKQNIGKAVVHNLYFGDMKANVDSKDAVIIPNSKPAIITVESENYQSSAGFAQLWNEIEDLHMRMKRNESTFDASTYYTLTDKMRMDVSRRRFEYMDFTDMMNTEISNPRFSKSVALDEFMPYTAAFEDNSLSGAAAPLAGQNSYGNTGAVTMQGYAAAYADTLEKRLYDMDIFTLQKVNDSIARGFVAKRNDLSVGLMVGKTFDASQKVAADTTGATAEDKLYITVDSGIEKLMSLKDPQTGQLIRANEIYAMGNPTDIRRLSRVLNGQLGNSGAIVNREPLREITNLFAYHGDSIKVGKNTYTYSGVTAKKLYLFVPRVGFTLVKRPLTQQISQGSALVFSTEEYGWYWVQTSYTAEFFGSSDSTVKSACNTAYGSGDGFGFVVEVTLP